MSNQQGQQGQNEEEQRRLTLERQRASNEIVCDKCKAVLVAGASLAEHEARVHNFKEEVKEGVAQTTTSEAAAAKKANTTSR